MKKLLLTLSLIASFALFAEESESLSFPKTGFYVGGKYLYLKSDTNANNAAADSLMTNRTVAAGTFSSSTATEDTNTHGFGITFGKQLTVNHAAEILIGFSQSMHGSKLSTFTSGEIFRSDIELDVVPVLAQYQGRYSFDDQFGVYGGAGAGVIYGKLSGTGANLTTGANSSFSDSDLAFAITGNIGAFYNVNENITVKGGFRYLDTTDFKFDVNAGRTKVKLDSSIWELGMDYNF